MLNLAPAAELSNEILRMVDILTPNQTAAQLLTGIAEVDGPESAARAAEMLHERGVENLVITLAQPEPLFHPWRSFHSGGIRSRSSSRYGCSRGYICGALAIAIARRQKLERCRSVCERCRGALGHRHGAQASIPSRKDVEILLNPIAWNY